LPERYQGEELAATFLGALFSVAAKRLEGGLSKFNEAWGLSNPFDVERSPRYSAFEEVRTKAVDTLSQQEPKLTELRRIITPSDGQPPNDMDFIRELSIFGVLGISNVISSWKLVSRTLSIIHTPTRTGVDVVVQDEIRAEGIHSCVRRIRAT
jgi:hypothetical protein